MKYTVQRIGRYACVGAVALLALSLCACTDETVESVATQVNYGVNINVPYATATPSPDAAPTSQPLVISSEGKVTLNDNSILEPVYTEAPSQLDEKGTGNYQRLQAGDQGDKVSELQTRLAQLNYYSGGVTGIYDTATQDAVKLFELTYGTMQTGVASPGFQDRLFSTEAPIYGSDAYAAAVASRYTTLQMGDVGSAVRLLQQRLQELGYPVIDVTGIFDSATGEAVSKFYQSYGFDANEVATVAMQRQLYSQDALTATDEGTEVSQRSDIYTISEGTIGSHVMVLQVRLQELGYMAPAASGTCDETTVAAIGAFQNMLGLAQTGEANYELQQLILGDAAPLAANNPAAQTDCEQLESGASGSAVSTMQNRLILLGYASGSANGRYDQTTLSVVNLFRKKCAMDETGVASQEVLALLYSPFAPLYDSGLPVGQSVGAVGGTGSLAGAMPSRALNEESSGEDVTVLETRLKELDYFDRTPDPTYDGNTAKAVQRFQKALGLEQTGEADVSLQLMLLSKAAPANGVRLYKKTQNFQELQRGDESTGVLNLQKRLWALGLLEKDALEGQYGVYNDVTIAAVRRAEQAMGYPFETESAGIAFQAYLFSDEMENLIG